MTQNIYDNAGFFAGYSQLRRSVDGLDGAPEWPTIKSMLPKLAAARVVDLGCGFGWFCRWAREAGAASVLGLDVSANMLARARETTPDPAIVYRQADLETLELPAASFDLAYSSLTLHYIEKLAALFATVHRAPRAGRKLRLLRRASALHRARARLSRRRPAHDGLAGRGRGEAAPHAGELPQPVIDAGFTVRRVEEWGPTREEIAAHPEWKIDHRRPAFLLVSAAR